MKKRVSVLSTSVDIIILTRSEEVWLEKIKSFRIDLNEEHNERLLKLENCFLLTLSLIERDAIPEHRVKYFTDATYNLSNTRSSRAEVFESNGTIGSNIFRHPHFLKYLKYFIYGADVPDSFKSVLREIKSSSFYDSDFREKVIPIIRNYYKANIEKASKKQFAEEIFKLALDLEVDFSNSVHLRNKVMTFS